MYRPLDYCNTMHDAADGYIACVSVDRCCLHARRRRHCYRVCVSVCTLAAFSTVSLSQTSPRIDRCRP